MKKKTKVAVIWGAVCALLIVISSYYTVAFNDSRFIVPMDFSEYKFRVQDLPMIVTGTFFVIYILYLFTLLAGAVIANKRKEGVVQSTRAVNPKLGFLGLFGFAGFSGFWTYNINKTIFPFVFFMFFGFFGFFYEGKMSHTFMDERYRENKMKAHMTANKIALAIIFLATLILGQGKLMGNLEYTLIALIIMVALSLALEVFLSEYLLFRYDHDEQFEEGEE